jgi:hypothetical protein
MVHSLVGIPNHDPIVRVAKENTRLRPSAATVSGLLKYFFQQISHFLLFIIHQYLTLTNDGFELTAFLREEVPEFQNYSSSSSTDYNCMIFYCVHCVWNILSDRIRSTCNSLLFFKVPRGSTFLKS